MKKFFIELGNRFAAPTPVFFKKIQVFGLSIAGCGTTLLSIAGIPPKIASMGSTMIWVGGIITALAQCAVKTASGDIEQK